MEVITAEEGAQTRVQEVGILQKEAGNYYLLAIIIIITTADSISRNERRQIQIARLRYGWEDILTISGFHRSNSPLLRSNSSGKMQTNNTIDSPYGFTPITATSMIIDGLLSAKEEELRKNGMILIRVSYKIN